MNLFLKQKVFSWRDKFTVYDEYGRARYYAYGEIFTWGRKLHITDLGGREVAFIRQELLSFLPKYYISRNGSKIAEVARKLTLFKPEYVIRGLNWNATGDFLKHDYEIRANHQLIAQVSKRWFSWGDTYGIFTATGVDEINVLAVVLVIDACLERCHVHSGWKFKM